MKFTFSVLVTRLSEVEVKRTVVDSRRFEEIVWVHVDVKYPVSVTVTVAFGRGQQFLQAD